VEGEIVNLLMIVFVALTGRVTEWEHFTHFGGISEIILEEDLLTGATSGGVIFGTLDSDSIVWDSVWTCPGELSTSDVRCLARDTGGNLWMGTNGGGIDVALASGGFTHYGQLEGLPLSLEITCILPDTTIWVGTTQGLCSRNVGYFDVWTQYSTGGGLPSDVVNSIAQVDSGLLVGTADGIVLLRADTYPGSTDSWFSFPSAADLSVSEIHVSGDTVWAATTTGLYSMVDWGDWLLDGTYPGDLPLSFDGDGSHLAVGGSEDICIFDGSSWTQGGYNLAGQQIRDIIWLSQDSLLLAQTSAQSDDRRSGNGVAIGVLDSWDSSMPDGAPSNDLLAVDVDTRNDVWVSTNSTGIGVLSQYGWTKFTYQLPGRHQIFVCTADNSGGVFIAPYHVGLTWLNWNGTPDRVDDVVISWDIENSDLLNNQITSASVSPTGDIWLGQEPFFSTPSEPSGVCRLSWTPGQAATAAWKSFQPSQGLPSGYVRDVLPAGTANIAWIATNSGLVKADILSGQVLFSAGTQSGLPSNDVTALSRGRSGVLWAGTTGGLASYEEGSGVFLESESASGAVEALGFDNLSNLWVASINALYRIAPDGSVETYNTINSPLQSLAIRGIASDPDSGYVYLATDHGMWKLTLAQGMAGNIETAQVYPNPFVPSAGEVLGVAGIPDEPFTFRLFDLTGRLAYEFQSTDRDSFAWSGTDDAGVPVASGTYIVQISQGGDHRFIKLALVR